MAKIVISLVQKKQKMSRMEYCMRLTLNIRAGEGVKRFTLMYDKNLTMCPSRPATYVNLTGTNRHNRQ